MACTLVSASNPVFSAFQGLNAFITLFFITSPGNFGVRTFSQLDRDNFSPRQDVGSVWIFLIISPADIRTYLGDIIV